MNDIIKDCLICGNQLQEPVNTGAGGNMLEFNCYNCGTYRFSDMLVLAIDCHPKSVEDRARVSYAIRRLQQKDKSPIIITTLMEQLLSTPLPSIKEQVDNLVIWLSKNAGGPTEEVHVSTLKHQAIVGSKTPGGVGTICKYLYEEKLIGDIGPISSSKGPDLGKFYLTVRGHNYLEKIQRESLNSRKAFMAMKFDDPELDNVVKEYFKPAVEKTGFDLRLLTDDERAGLIDDRLRIDLRTSRFIIADLTHGNLGVYWEAGFAEGSGKPVIYTCRKDVFDDPQKKPHFDTNHYLCVPWDPTKLKAAADKLKAIIRATLPGEATLTD